MSSFVVKPIRRNIQRNNDANKKISSMRNVCRVRKFKLHSGGTLKVPIHIKAKSAIFLYTNITDELAQIEFISADDLEDIPQQD